MIDLEPKGGEALLSADHTLNRDDFDDDDLPSDGAIDSSIAWYAIWTRSHCERLVAQQLLAKGFQAFLPEMTIRSRGEGTPIVQRPMFPGYLFLRHSMEKQSYIEILKARGVVRILEGG